jgi:hypothetical protein
MLAWLCDTLPLDPVLSPPGASVAAAAAARMAAAAAAAAAEPHKIWTDPDFEIPVSLAMGYEKECHLLLVALLDRFAGLVMNAYLRCTHAHIRIFVYMLCSCVRERMHDSYRYMYTYARYVCIYVCIYALCPCAHIQTWTADT